MKLIFLLVISPLSIFAQHDAFHDCFHEGQKCEIAPSVVRVYPNPTRDIFQIRGLKAENTEGVLYDGLGREIMKIKLQNEVDIDISALAATVYFLKIRHEPTLKIVKN